MTQQYEGEEFEERGHVTAESLKGLYEGLCKEKGRLAYHEDCPTPSHIAGYYIESYGSLDSAIAGLQRTLSGKFQDLRAFPGDENVLAILEYTKFQQETE